MTAVESGAADAKNNLLKERPAHGGQDCQRQLEPALLARAGGVSGEGLHDYKFWPHVSRVDNVFGDRNLVCSCAGMENYS